MDLATLWFFIVGVLFVGYFVLDGFDFGVGMSLPFLGKDEVSLFSYIDNVLAHHFETYQAEITELYNEHNRSIF